MEKWCVIGEDCSAVFLVAGGSRGVFNGVKEVSGEEVANFWKVSGFVSCQLDSTRLPLCIS